MKKNAVYFILRAPFILKIFNFLSTTGRLFPDLLQLWNLIKYAELKEVVRQNDKLFIGLVNNLRVGNVDDHVENLLMAKFIYEPDRNFSKDALHMHEENKTAARRNESVLNELSGKRYTIEANCKTLDNCKYPLTLIQHAQNPKQ